eukprot:TRINITY_DN5498_c0_g1_i1.p1 TRINITY_DN5498_c0_g1~~TRINITY_DN5498_c0_g1_i1.p1  ORF type:complete len:482 (-),score=40.57 TRINITY_DN5498_c0_g1_i1:248-1654(-)
MQLANRRNKKTKTKTALNGHSQPSTPPVADDDGADAAALRSAVVCTPPPVNYPVQCRLEASPDSLCSPQQLWWCGRQTCVKSADLTDSSDFAPLTAFSGMTIVKVAAAHDHLVILDDQGHVYTWGSSAQLGIGDAGSNFRECYRVVRSAATGTCKDNDLINTVFVDVAANLAHSLLVSDCGDVYSFGTGGARRGEGGGNYPGRLSDFGPTGRFQALRAEAATSDSIVLTTKQDLVIIGSETLDTHVPPSKYGQIVSFCLTDSGSVYFVTDQGKLWSLLQHTKTITEISMSALRVHPIKLSTRGAHVILLTGYPEWNFSTHKYFDTAFKQMVTTVLMISSHCPRTKAARHPECGLALLPKEIVFMIISVIASFALAGHVFSLRDGTLDQKTELTETVIDIAAGYDHTITLSASGRIFSWGDDGYGQTGCSRVGESKSKIREPQSLANRTVKRIFAGSYYSVAMVDPVEK